MALAVACACTALTPLASGRTWGIAAGIVAGIAVALAQYLARRRAGIVASLVATTFHLVLWTALARATGGIRSPLTALYLFEVPLSGMALGARGIAFAAIGAVLATTLALGGDVGADGGRNAVLAGLIAASAALTAWMQAVDRRRLRELDAAHEALRRRADDLGDELRRLGDYMSGGLVAVDHLGRVASINPAAATLLGVAPHEAIGRAWQEVLRPVGDDAGALAHAILGAAPARDLSLALELPCGRRVAVLADVFASCASDPARSYVMLAPLAADATDADPLRRLGEAAAHVFHQVRNSLQALQSLAGRIDAPDAGAAIGARTTATADLRRALGTLGELAEDVLSMSDTRDPEAALALEPVLATATLLARRNDVPIVTHARRGSGVLVRARRGRLVHALFNLIDNACRVSGRDGAVEIVVGASDDEAWVEICDRGPGPPDAATRAQAARDGHGLGLAAAHRFVESCGGRIEFFPRGGGGSRCRVRLQRVPAAEFAGQA